MLHFGTVPFPLRVLHLNAWIPAFALKAPLALKNTSHLGQKDARDKRARGNAGKGQPPDMEKPPEEGAQGGFPFRIS